MSPALEWSDGSLVHDRHGRMVRTRDVVSWAGGGSWTGRRGVVLRLLDRRTVRVAWAGRQVGDVDSGMVEFLVSSPRSGRRCGACGRET